MKSRRSSYTEATEGLNEFGQLLCGLIKELLVNAGIPTQNITYRVKDYKSASQKMDLGAKKYLDISELTDLLGVRIITYFANDVDRVAKVIQREFAIDKANSIDKRKVLETDRFGYLSLHYVSSLSHIRSNLTEYKRFAQKPFELQVCSILQHAWAEIEHDLGYKAEGELPQQIKRRFFRLAGSLELADEEFDRLRNNITQYEKEVDATIKTAPEKLSIDQSTVIAALEQENSLIRLDKAVADAAGSGLKEKVDAMYAGREAKELKALGIKDIKRLLLYSDKYREHVSLFARIWCSDKGVGEHDHADFHRGIGLFYLGYALAAQRKPTQLKKWGLRIKDRQGNLLNEVQRVWQEVVDKLGPPPKV